MYSFFIQISYGTLSSLILLSTTSLGIKKWGITNFLLLSRFWITRTAAVKSVVEDKSTPPIAYESLKSSIEYLSSLFKSSNDNQEPEFAYLMLKSLQSIVTLVDSSCFDLFITSSK